MAILDIKLPNSILKALRLPQNNPRRQQLKVLKKMLRKARFTEFGQTYHFDDILVSKHPGKKFQELVPTYNYNKIYQEWWHKTLEGKSDICWPGKIKYYALSSGTSESASKFIPVTNDLLRGNKIVMIKQFKFYFQVQVQRLFSNPCFRHNASATFVYCCLLCVNADV